jgi:hypothetical protein
MNPTYTLRFDDHDHYCVVGVGLVGTTNYAVLHVEDASRLCFWLDLFRDYAISRQ